jgi:hypothetical protein
VQKKQDLEGSGTFDGLRAEFRTYFQHVAAHTGDSLDYVFLRKLFSGLYSQEGFEYDHVLDWTELKSQASLEGSEA